MKVLVIGGNRFFGKRLVGHLLERNAEVTLLNRGNLDDGYGHKIKRIRLDRANLSTCREVLDFKWDVVYDQTCYNVEEATKAAEVFNGRCDRYIFTSTQSVYTSGQVIPEEAFDPLTYKFTKIADRVKEYGEAKRQAETVLFREMTMPLVAVRYPIVLGTDDYTERLKFHVERIARQMPFQLTNPAATICFITSTDAAKFLDFLADKKFTGPVNCCSTDPIVISELIHQIENITRKRAKISKSGEMSPFNFETDCFLSTKRVNDWGFYCQPLSEWMPELIKYFSAKY